MASRFARICASSAALVAATVPCALFGALFAQSVVQCAVARARPAKGRVAEAAAWPCAGVQALTLLYYVVERSDAACLLTAPPFLSDVSGVTARPLHLVLWTCSVSAQVLAIYSVERELSARMPRPPPTNARRDCCAALVAVLFLMGLNLTLDDMRAVRARLVRPSTPRLERQVPHVD